SSLVHKKLSSRHERLWSRSHTKTAGRRQNLSALFSLLFSSAGGDGSELKHAHTKPPEFSNSLLLVSTLSLALCHRTPLVITSVTLPLLSRTSLATLSTNPTPLSGRGYHNLAPPTKYAPGRLASAPLHFGTRPSPSQHRPQ
ncbi:unnamed protein product, partial [Ectocarpus sp. 8 AP-2014]